jgi:single stranded DNA-binding protein
MSRGINKMIVIGMVGENPELKYTISGEAIVNFSLGVKEDWGKEDNQKHTDWFIVEAYGKGAELMGQRLHKGDYIYLEGVMHTDQWDKDGVVYYTAKLLAQDFLLLLPRSDQAKIFAAGNEANKTKGNLALIEKIQDQKGSP